jgi:hypothetical protein
VSVSTRGGQSTGRGARTERDACILAICIPGSYFLRTFLHDSCSPSTCRVKSRVLPPAPTRGWGLPAVRNQQLQEVARPLHVYVCAQIGLASQPVAGPIHPSSRNSRRIGHVQHSVRAQKRERREWCLSPRALSPFSIFSPRRCVAVAVSVSVCSHRRVGDRTG